MVVGFIIIIIIILKFTISPLLANNGGELQQSLCHQLRMLDEVSCGVNDTRNQDLVIRNHVFQ